MRKTHPNPHRTADYNPGFKDGKKKEGVTKI
jgi:hypothetical protein